LITFDVDELPQYKGLYSSFY